MEMRVIDFVSHKNKAYQKEKETQMNTKRKKSMSITKERKMEIEKIVARELLGTKLKKDPYVDIVSLVENKGFSVETENMDINTTGILYVNDDVKRIIVNENFKNPYNEERVVLKKSRFITAHEYGHYLLHREQLGTPILAHRDTDNRTAQIELEADYFARSILMPLEAAKLYYKAAIQMFDDEDNNFIAYVFSKVFGVTQNKALRRLEDLSELD